MTHGCCLSTPVLHMVDTGYYAGFLLEKNLRAEDNRPLFLNNRLLLLLFFLSFFGKF